MKKLIKTEIIDEYLKKNGLSKRKFCEMVGFSYSTLKKMYDGKGNFSLKAYVKLVTFLGIVGLINEE